MSVQLKNDANILVVDDSMVARMGLKKVLLNLQSTLQVAQAADGKEAIEQVQNARFDLAFVDYNMPGIDGLECSHKLKEIQADLPIFLLTADVQTTLEEKAEALGINYLEKASTS